MKRALVQTIETEQLKPLICPSRNMQTHNLVPSCSILRKKLFHCWGDNVATSYPGFYLRSPPRP